MAVRTMVNDRRRPDARPLAVDLQQLRLAVTAADIGSFRQAAEVLRLRQSQMSRCVRQVNRIFAQDMIHDAFVARLSRAVRELKVGDGFNKGVTIGPLINQAAVKKVEEHIQDATGKGAKVAVGGKRHALGRYFFEPTVLTGATPDMRIFREETFGPVAPVFRFTTEEQATRLVVNRNRQAIASFSEQAE
jgi:acyl-CoA reductase-like NAD-dependent aldehyde dehydrogenase